MPNPAQTFQGMQPPQDGPFSDYLRPRPIDNLPPPGQGATGYESGPVGAGKLALNFLQGIRQNRIANFMEQERNTEAKQNAFIQHGNTVLQRDDLTNEGVQAVKDALNNTLVQHSQYEMRDIPKHGVLGFLKNALTQMSGGPIKTRDPIDFQKERGAIGEIADTPVYSKAYWRGEANKQLAAIDTSKMTAEQVMSSAAQIARGLDLQRHLGQDAGTWIQQAAIGKLGANTPAGMVESTRPPTPASIPTTAAPPSAPPTQAFTGIASTPPSAPPLTMPLPASIAGALAPPDQPTFHPVESAGSPTAQPPTQPAPTPVAAAGAPLPNPGDYVTVAGKRVKVKSVNQQDKTFDF